MFCSIVIHDSFIQLQSNTDYNAGAGGQVTSIELSGDEPSPDFKISDETLRKIIELRDRRNEELKAMESRYKDNIKQLVNEENTAGLTEEQYGALIQVIDEYDGTSNAPEIDSTKRNKVRKEIKYSLFT